MPNNRELEIINSSGDLTEIKLGGADAEKVVLTKEQVEALFGNWQFVGDELNLPIGIVFFYETEEMQFGDSTYSIQMASILNLTQTIAQIDSGSHRIAVTKEWTEGKFGNFTFEGNDLKHGTGVLLNSQGNANIVKLTEINDKNYVNLQSTSAEIRHEFNASDISVLSLQDNQAYYGIIVGGISKQVHVDTIKGITLAGQSIAEIDSGGGNMIATKEWVQAEIAKNLP